jgi:phosphoglycerol transferase MdoB-like AlkP superfamily enzyme
MVSRIHALPDISSDLLFNRISWREMVIICSMGFAIVMYETARRCRHWMAGNDAFKGFPNVSFLCVTLLVVLFVKGLAFNVRYPPWNYEPAYAVESLKRNGFIAFYGHQFLSSFEKKSSMPVFPGKIVAANGRSVVRLKRVSPQPWNVIFIQVESLESRVLDVKVGDDYLLPNLQWLKENSIFCSNFFAHHRAGGSQDSELGAFFSLIPSNKHPGFRHLAMSKTKSLSDVMESNRYHRSVFHSNHGSFFDRKWLYENMGFDLFVDNDGFVGEAKGWYAKDRPFFEQSWSMIETLPRPFFAYLITMQSHSPYRNYTDRSEKIDFSGHADSNQAYLRSMFEVDDAIGRFFELLRNSRLGENTLVFVYGDHGAGEQYDAPDYAYPALRPAEHVPMFVYVPGLEARNVKRVCSQIDLAPTVCELLGVPAAEGWMGSSIFDGEHGKAVLNYPMPLVIENAGDTIEIREAQPEEMKYVKFSEAMQGNP